MLTAMDNMEKVAIARKNTPDAHNIQFAVLTNPNHATKIARINVMVPAKYIGIAINLNMS